jgi:hypothetical protein
MVFAGETIAATDSDPESEHEGVCADAQADGARCTRPALLLRTKTGCPVHVTKVPMEGLRFTDKARIPHVRTDRARSVAWEADVCIATLLCAPSCHPN